MIKEYTADDFRRMAEDAKNKRLNDIEDAEVRYHDRLKELYEYAKQLGLVDSNGNAPWNRGYEELKP